jgi:8-oxo-dGTP pyrophosphatase MutT (NUDIX family)
MAADPTPPPYPGRQVIPRPPHHRLGGPSPWAGLPQAARTGLGLARVVDTVRRAREDGAPAIDQEMSEFLRRFSDVDVAQRPSAVLLALFEEDGETRVVLTVRSSRLRSHRGEVAFPGGRLDAGETVQEAALREAFEEVGLDPASVTLVGELTVMPTVSSNTLMTPVVATLPGRPGLVAAPDEVDRVFDVSLSELVADGVFLEEWWAAPGRPGADGRAGGEFPVWFYRAGGEIIWGATARVLTELLCLVLALPGTFDRPGELA